MDHTEYLELDNRINAYRKGVTNRAAGWINENVDGVTIDNSFEDPNAYNTGLAVTIGVEAGEFLVWLTRNSDDGDNRRVGVPATLLDGVEA